VLLPAAPLCAPGAAGAVSGAPHLAAHLPPPGPDPSLPSRRSQRGADGKGAAPRAGTGAMETRGKGEELERGWGLRDMFLGLPEGRVPSSVEK